MTLPLIQVWSEQGPTYDGPAAGFDFCHGLTVPLPIHMAQRAAWFGYQVHQCEEGELFSGWHESGGKWTATWQRAEAGLAPSPALSPGGLPALPPISGWPDTLPAEYVRLLRAYDGQGRRKR